MSNRLHRNASTTKSRMMPAGRNHHILHARIVTSSLRAQYNERCQQATTLAGRSWQTPKVVLLLRFTCCTVVYGTIYVYRRAALEKQDLHLCNFSARQPIAEIVPGPMRRIGHTKWKIERSSCEVRRVGPGRRPTQECRTIRIDRMTGSWINGSGSCVRSCVPKGTFDCFASSFGGVLAVHGLISRAYSHRAFVNYDIPLGQTLDVSKMPAQIQSRNDTGITALAAEYASADVATAVFNMYGTGYGLSV